MPTVLLLDTSLSMARPVTLADSSQEYQRRHLAIHGINCFLDQIAAHSKLEFVCLMTFSATPEVVVPFTRDYDSIRSAVDKTEEQSKTCIEAALVGVANVVMDEWGVSTFCQIVLITDGSTGTGATSLRRSLSTRHRRDTRAGDAAFPLPYAFASSLHVVCVAPPGDGGGGGDDDAPALAELAALGGGAVSRPEPPLTPASVGAVLARLAGERFAPRAATLKCGHLRSAVQLVPAPRPYDCEHDFERVQKSVSSTIEICGFLDIADLSSPPYVSRHLVLPVPDAVVKTEGGKEEDDDPGEGKTAAFTVLLHGSLKVEGMAALIQLADDWYGVMYSWADNKKKSNLMLSIFKPGNDHLPWLGNLSHLAPVSDFVPSPYGGDDGAKSPFPVKPLDRRSYAQNCVVWIKPSGVQTDIQKILRSAKKLPEKQQHFYKELNRLRRAALAFGFHDLLDAVAELLDRECTLLPGNAHPGAALQLSHAATALRAADATNVAHNIAPLRTNFSSN